jgi:hypothetical protein
MSACCRIGALLGGLPAAQIDALTRYGLDIGVAFGDVVSAGWRSGSQGKAAERGKFGSLEIWRGALTNTAAFIG